MGVDGLLFSECPRELCFWFFWNSVEEVTKSGANQKNNTRGEKLEGSFFIGSDYVIVSGSI